MRNAIVYTGQIRTMSYTIKGLKANVMQYENCQIFAVLQGEESEKLKYSQLLIEEFKDKIRQIRWLDANDETYLKIKSNILNNMHIDDGSKNYLNKGGSIIEYYQLQCAYKDIVRTELIEKFTYDYIIRCRTDTLFLQPIDFSWLKLTNEDIQTRLMWIHLVQQRQDMKRKELITYFMATLIKKELILNINSLLYSDEEFPAENQYLNQRDLYLLNVLNCQEENLVENIKEYIKNGMYILTMRKNLLYIVKREFFSLIPSLGTFYGSLDFFKTIHWWNAESQFRSACAYSQLSIYNYDTVFEDKSLYNADPKDYEGKPSLYFLMRNQNIIPTIVKKICEL